MDSTEEESIHSHSTDGIRPKTRIESSHSWSFWNNYIPSECDEEEFLQSEKLEKIVDMFVESGHGHPIHSETLQFLLKGERRREDEKKVFRNVRMLNIPLKAQRLKVSEEDEKYEPQTFSQEDAITHPLSEQKE